ncbi:uncharacterized protein CTRU02_202756 [Colletotrichum truncatum]|uniref:Uncharacterized protein n=1 Tax=Colletotrichum truncatum TaxID=5467 RepID=A0ACC3ZL78_COLTU|nr:uncharacterized protein CTRU02_10681 [Colletotrichum truncatum]KAF6786982.1 hypothetical protein CTRU02_10681 [Colletotrichum truncatum]
MFRPWNYHPQENSPWAGFNNIQTGNRVNINTFNAFPRQNGPVFNPGLRLFDFANLFNLTNNFGNETFQNDGRLRNRVTVILPDGSHVMIDRNMMHEHFPRTRNAVQDSFFAVPEFLRGYNPGFAANAGFNPHNFHEAFSRAAGFVFRYIEMLCRPPPFGVAQSPDLFARPRFLLANIRDRVGTIHEIFWHVLLLCCVLDQDRALGCSEMFARSIGEFLVEFMPRVETYMPPGAAQLLFVGYARIFRETRFEMEVLRELWEMMDDVDQVYLRNMIGPQLAGNGMGNNAHRIWTALRHLGLV